MMVAELLLAWKQWKEAEELDPNTFLREVLWHVEYQEYCRARGIEIPLWLDERAVRGIVDDPKLMNYLHLKVDHAGRGAVEIAKAITPILLDVHAQRIGKFRRNPVAFTVAALVIAERRK